MKHTQMFCVAALCSVFALGAWGQSTATISGTVTDPSGAVVVNAHVTVHSLATGADRVINTDTDGLYAVPSLQPGDYNIQATAPGLTRVTQTELISTTRLKRTSTAPRKADHRYNFVLMDSGPLLTECPSTWGRGE